MKTDSEHALGGIPIPVDRRKMKMGFWLATGALVYYLIFFNDAPIPLSRLGGSLLLVAAILLPAWLWVAGKAQGVPLYPLYCLFFFPTYAVPLCRGDSRFVEYTELQIANGVFTLAGFILLGTLVWHQCVNHNLKPKPMVRALDPAGSIGLMIAFLLVGIAFEFVGDLLGAFGGGLYQAGRGYAQNASRLAVFILFYQIGCGGIKGFQRQVVILLTTGFIIRQTASILLANAFPAIGLAFAGFILGGRKLPWKPLAAVVGVIMLLHSGKAEMRSIYWGGGVQVTLADYPRFFTEWIGKGVVGLTKGKNTEGVEIQGAKERSALLPLLLKIQKMTPAEVPFLEGASYQYLLSMLVPRIITKDKAVSHISNIILSLHYGILTKETVMYTSIAFDLVMEAFANYGYMGVGGLAIVMGLFLGLVGLGTTGVPLFSFRFLLSVIVLSAVVSANNTMGVFVTTSWQGFLALVTLSLLIMKTIPNPLYAKPGTGARTTDLERGKTIGNREAVVDRSDVSPDPQSPIPNPPPPEAAVRHARPTRFVYGEKKEGG